MFAPSADGAVLSIHLIRRCARLQDISPEDLFPPVSFSISEKADEDMPYTKPVTDAATGSTEQAAKEKPQPSAEAHKKSDRSESPVPIHGNGSQAFTQPTGASGEPEVRAGSGNGAKPESSTEDQLDRRRAEGALGLQLGEDLPLVLSTLENASVQEALSLDSDIAGVVEAVANGDIKPFTDSDLAAKASLGSNSAGEPSVGRGPLKDKVAPPAKVRPSLHAPLEACRVLPLQCRSGSCASLLSYLRSKCRSTIYRFLTCPKANRLL